MPMMRYPSARPRAFFAVAGLAASVAIGVFAASSTLPARDAEKAPSGPPAQLTIASPDAGWKEVDKLVEEHPGLAHHRPLTGETCAYYPPLPVGTRSGS